MKKILLMFMLIVLMACTGCGENNISDQTDNSDITGSDDSNSTEISNSVAFIEINNSDPTQTNIEELDGSLIMHEYTSAYFKNKWVDDWSPRYWSVWLVPGEDKRIGGYTEESTSENRYKEEHSSFKYEYDEYDRLYKIFRNNTLYKTFFYYSQGIVCNIFDENENPTESQKYIYHINSLGQVENVDVYDDSNQELFTIIYEYDDEGHIVSRQDISSNGNILQDIINVYEKNELAGTRIRSYESDNEKSEYVYLCKKYDNHDRVFRELTSVQRDNTELGCDSLNLFLNDGIYASYDGWTYYSSSDSYIKRVDANGTVETVCRVDGQVRCINIISDWIYYVYGQSIRRIKRDGSGNEEIVVTENVWGQLIVKGDLLYYKSRVYDSSTITHFEINEFNIETGKNRVLSKEADILGIVDNFLYYKAYFKDEGYENIYFVARINLDNYEYGSRLFRSDKERGLIGISDHYLLIQNNKNIEVKDLTNEVDGGELAVVAVYEDILNKTSDLKQREFVYYYNGKICILEGYYSKYTFICTVDQDDIGIYESGEREWKDIMNYVVEEEYINYIRGNNHNLSVYVDDDFIYYSIGAGRYRVKLDGTGWTKL